LALLRGTADEACAAAERALTITGRLSRSFLQCFVLCDLGDAQLASGEPELALTT
jgi:hypothetical protein